MKCPKCDSKKTSVVNKLISQDNEVYKKRACIACGHIFYTTEFEVDFNEQFKKEWDEAQRNDVSDEVTMHTRHYGYRCEHIGRPKQYVYVVYQISDILPDRTVREGAPALGFFDTSILAEKECQLLEKLLVRG